jgi:uncharacterized protein (TIGR02996 family)
MSTADELIEAIRADPEDDEARKDYARWLDGQGDPLGEFIWVQLDLARKSKHSAERWRLVQREKEMLEEYSRKWSHCLVADVRFERGFVDYLETDPQLFFNEPEAYLQACPLLRTLYFCNVSTSSHEYTDFLDENKDYYVAGLASPLMGRLQGLSMRDNNIGNGAAAAIAGNPHAASLHTLDMSINRIGDAGAEALAASPYLGELRILDLTYNPIGAQARERLRARFGRRVLLRYGGSFGWENGLGVKTD